MGSSCRTFREEPLARPCRFLNGALQPSRQNERCHENASDCLRLDRCGGDAGDASTCLLQVRRLSSCRDQAEIGPTRERRDDTRSISPTSRKGSDFNSTPNDGATLWIAANCDERFRGSCRTATCVMLGAISLSNSNHCALVPYSPVLKPVALLPGRAKFSTNVAANTV